MKIFNYWLIPNFLEQNGIPNFLDALYQINGKETNLVALGIRTLPNQFASLGNIDLAKARDKAELFS